VSAARTALGQALERLLCGRDLEIEGVDGLLDELAAEETPRALQGAFLTALRAKGESPAELAALARALLGRARPVPRDPARPCLDTAGTGGDGTRSFNLSSAAALLAAALGIPVAKHGNRAVSSRSGSADLYEALGLRIPRTGDEAAAALARDGFVFLFAPHYHPATAVLASVRRELGVRTVFNLLGPLVNPARPTHQLLGAATPEVAAKLARALLHLEPERAFVVHGDGFDEATPCGPFLVLEVGRGRIEERWVSPESFGLGHCRPEDLAGGDPAENARLLRELFEGRRGGPLRDAVCLNAALALLLVGLEHEPRRALGRARAALEDGTAAAFLARLEAPVATP